MDMKAETTKNEAGIVGENWPAAVREKFAKAAAALAEKAKAGGWSDHAKAKMQRALTDEHHALAKIEQLRNRRIEVERKLSAAKKGEARKRDTQEKIVLGAVVKKVGLVHERDDGSIEPSVLAGMLLDVAEQLKQKAPADVEAKVAAWREAGKEIVAAKKGEATCA